MSEQEYEGNDEESNDEYVRVDVEQDWDLPEPPYFYSPYPAKLVQVKVPETRGGRAVAELVNEYWPAEIGELEEYSREEYEDGYSGSFIRNILRSHYVPEDKAREAEQENMVQIEEGENEKDVEGLELPDSRKPKVPEDEAWHVVFRMGLRAALQNQISEKEAYEAFGSGFVEGQKLKEEMEL